MKLITLLLILIFFCPLIAASVPIRNIILSGNEAFSDEQLIALMQTQVEKDYDEAVLKGDFDRIVNFYRKHGFPFARIDEKQLRIRKFPEGVYILMIPIDEGNIKKITVMGNTRTRSSVIIQELLFQVGDTYTVEDELESERILRRKAYLGTVEIAATWDQETMGVWITVVVTDLWTLIPALDVPAFGNNSSNFLAQLADSNVFGSGNFARFRYKRVNEDGEPRSLILSRYMIPRLFESHWVFDGEYTQKRKGDSWKVRLGRPQYSLKTHWSADFRMSASFDEIRWYERGEKTDTFERSSQFYSGKVTRIFGDRHSQIELSLWTFSRRTRFTHVEQLRPSNAKFRDRKINMIGGSLGRREVDFIRTRFLNQMGRVEDIGIGHAYSASIGHASPLYGADRSDVNLNLLFSLSQAHQDLLFLRAQTEFTTRLAAKFSDSVLNTSLKLVRKDLFYQTLAAQISTMMEFGLSGESQIILGGLNGLRGYSSRQFSGEKAVLLNLESRTIFRGGIFRTVSPWIVLGSAVFVDVGYVWNGEQFDLHEPIRSVGFGIRASIPKLSGSRVYRLDLAYPLDEPEKSSKPVFTYGIGHLF